MQHLHTLEIPGAVDRSTAPPRNPNEHLRARISQMAAVGLPPYQIAFIANIRLATLQNFFAEEMEGAAAEANLEILQTLFKLAKSGKHPSVTMFWAKSRCSFQPRAEKPKWEPYDWHGQIPRITVVGPNGEPLARNF